MPEPEITYLPLATAQWVNGLDAVHGFTEQFKQNLGPAEKLPDMLGRYWVRNLYYDPDTTTRIDHIRNDPGYRDLTYSYHRSVEESLVLHGGLIFDPEGEFQAGDYFWRPAGFSHIAVHAEFGAESLLMMTGVDEEEDSGVGDRNICPPETAGRNLLHPDGSRRSVGSRGWIRRLKTPDLAWSRVVEPGWYPVLGDGVQAKELSRNPTTRAVSALQQLPRGVTATVTAEPRRVFAFVTAGRLESELGPLEYGTALLLPPGASLQLRATNPAQLFVKG